MNKILCIILIFIVSCSVDKTDINYGEEVCSHCHMVIMDGRYGAELVTNKGKVYKFDAMECLINYKHSNPNVAQDLNSEWTNIYTKKNTLYDARKCVYLRSQELPSPMGAYLTAFDHQQSAEEFKIQHGGIIYTWDQLNDQFKMLPVINQEN